MQSFEINSFLSGVDIIDATAKSVRELFLEESKGRTHSDRVNYSAAPHDPKGFIAHVLHAKITARFEYARYVAPDFKIISGQYIFAMKIDDKEVKLPTRLRIVGPNNLVLPGGQVCSLHPPGSIGPYGNMLWDAVTYALLGEVLGRVEDWENPPRA